MGGSSEVEVYTDYLILADIDNGQGLDGSNYKLNCLFVELYSDPTANTAD